DALELALRAVGIGPKDEVIVPANTFIATALAVVRAGATPALVDSDPVHHLIDVEQISGRIGPRTRAILPVHLYGQLAPMERLRTLAERTGVLLLEDAAQAHGATQQGVPAGSFGVAAGTSFYPAKNLGAYGDAGAVLTNSDDVARKVRTLRKYRSRRALPGADPSPVRLPPPRPPTRGLPGGGGGRGPGALPPALPRDHPRAAGAGGRRAHQRARLTMPRDPSVFVHEKGL